MAEALRHYLYYTFHSLSKYDIMALGWVLFLALLLIVLAAFIRRRALSYFLLFIGLFLLFVGPPSIKMAMDAYLRNTTLTLEKIKSLRYSHALLLEGSLKNDGKMDYTACDLVAFIYSATYDKSWKKWLRPKRVAIHRLPGPIERGETKPYRIIVDHFNTKEEINATLIARCYP